MGPASARITIAASSIADALRQIPADANGDRRLTSADGIGLVVTDLERGVQRIVVIDARSPQHFGECHVPGAINLPHRSINEESTAPLSKDVCIVVYCWGPACNAAARAGVRLGALGFQVKEMIGGIAYWFPHQGSVSTAILVDYDGQKFTDITTAPVHTVAVHALINF